MSGASDEGEEDDAGPLREDSLATRLVNGDKSAQSLLDAECARVGMTLIPDHDSRLFVGGFVVRPGRPPTAVTRIAELARSWERFDRAFVQISDLEEPSDELLAQEFEYLNLIMDFVERTGLVDELSTDHLFVFGEGEQQMLFSFDDDNWARLFPEDEFPRDAKSAEAMQRFRSRLQRGPRPHE